MSSGGSTALLFPGQGAQYIGMGRALFESFAPAGALLERAGKQTGVDMARLCYKGPMMKLSRTDLLQPAVTAVNLGAYLYWRGLGGEADMTAGHSLGELSALAAAECISPETALDLSVIRGRLMHEASRMAPGNMAAVTGLNREAVRGLLSEVDPDTPVVVANLNTPDQIVLSGSAAAMKRLRGAVIRRGGRWVPLQVSGAWHSPLMEPVVERWRTALDEVRFEPPRIPIYLNVTGQPARNVDDIRTALTSQLTRPVKWASIIRALAASGVTRYIIPGPGKALKHIVRKNISDPDTVLIEWADTPEKLDRLFAA